MLEYQEVAHLTAIQPQIKVSVDHGLGRNKCYDEHPDLGLVAEFLVPAREIASWDLWRA